MDFYKIFIDKQKKSKIKKKNSQKNLASPLMVSDEIKHNSNESNTIEPIIESKAVSKLF